MLGRKYAGAPGVRPGKLNRRFHALASRRSEERFRQSAPGSLTQLFCQLPGEIGHVSLNHGRATTLKFVVQRAHYFRMIVPDVVYAIAGKKIENPPALVGE